MEGVVDGRVDLVGFLEELLTDVVVGAGAGAGVEEVAEEEASPPLTYPSTSSTNLPISSFNPSTNPDFPLIYPTNPSSLSGTISFCFFTA